MTDSVNLEPRVMKVETEIESVVRDISVLTRDVRDLSSIVRQQGENAESQMRQLHVAITSAAGPRKTDWGMLISAVGLVMAIGTAALSPLYLRMADVQTLINKQEQQLEKHTGLELHPVGKTRIDALEKALIKQAEMNAKGIAELDTKLQMEASLFDAAVRERVNTLDAKLQAEMISTDKKLQNSDLQIQKQLDEIDTRGSAAIREKIAVIENELKRLLKADEARKP